MKKATEIKNAYEVLKGNETNWAEAIANIDWGLNRTCQLAGSGICSWCPNTKKNKPEDEILMSDVTVARICDQLAEAGYKGQISLNRYNEPFVLGKALADKIALIRSYLPENRIGINTNGFLVTKELLKAVYTAGLSSMNFQLYPVTRQEEEEFTFEWALAKAQKFCHKLGLEIDDIKTKRVDGFYYEFSIILPSEWTTLWGTPSMTMYAKRLTKLGCDRGGTVSALKCTQRQERCPQIGHFLAIDADGNCSPCTNCTGKLLGINSHEAMILGNVKDTPLSEIFARIEPQRRALNEEFSAESLEKYSICKHCSFIPHVAQMNRLAEGTL